MRVFISGATGVLGRRVVERLGQSGHQIVGLSRSQANTEWLSNNGAEPRRGDLFDVDSMRDLSADCEAILHLATAIPTKSRPTRADWATNDRIRREGTRNLIQAALWNTCHLYVQQSVALIYGEQNGDWVEETTPIPEQQAAYVQSAVDMEEIVQEAVDRHNLPAITLRFGSFYSYDSAQTRSMLEMAQKGFFPIVGDGDFYWNPLNVDDAAGAVAAAVENYENGLGQTFNVCDDEPVTFGDLLNYVAETLGARRPFRIPVFLAKLMLGSDTVEVLRSSARCKNQLVKDTLGWTPRYATYRQGYRAEIEKWNNAFGGTIHE